MVCEDKITLGLSPNGKAQDFDSCTVGSSPTSPVVPLPVVPLAQLEEHLTFNQGVVGSSPIWHIRTFSSIG